MPAYNAAIKVLVRLPRVDMICAVLLLRFSTRYRAATTHEGCWH